MNLRLAQSKESLRGKNNVFSSLRGMNRSHQKRDVFTALKSWDESRMARGVYPAYSPNHYLRALPMISSDAYAALGALGESNKDPDQSVIDEVERVKDLVRARKKELGHPILFPNPSGGIPFAVSTRALNGDHGSFLRLTPANEATP